MRLINANKLESDMYHSAFEIDTDLQKWDSGCWIRYKMFENVIEEQPTVKAIPIEWIKKWISERNDFPTMPYNRHIWNMLDDWEKANANN